MPTTVLSNKKNSSLVIHVAGANSGNIVVAGNSSTTNVGTSAVCVAVGNEVLTGAYITQAVFGMDPSATIQIFRGANLVACYDSTGQHEYAGAGMPLTVNQAANVSVVISGSANAFITFEMQKVGTFISEYLQN